MKKIALPIVLLTTVATCGLLSSCTIGHYRYDDAKSYSKLEGDLVVTKDSIDVFIEWYRGDVTVSIGEVEHITISQVCDEVLSDNFSTYYLLNENKVLIRYGKSGVTYNSQPDKDINIVIPASVELGSYELRTVEADIKIKDVSVSDLSIKTVSGKVSSENVEVDGNLTLESVSGDFETPFDKVSGKVVAKSVSGDFTLDLPSINSIEVETVSGKANVIVDDIETTGKFETVSGNFTLNINPEMAFTLTFKSTSGDFDTPLAVAKDGSTYQYGPQEATNAQLTYKSLSGDLTIKSQA